MTDGDFVDTSEYIPDSSVDGSIADNDGQQDQSQDAQTVGGDVGQSQTPQISPDEIIRQAEEKAFQRTASWMGRRDKDLLDNISNLIDTRLRAATPPPQTHISSDPATILDDPDMWAETKIRQAVPGILNDEIQRLTQKDQQYTADIIREAGRIMDVDPLFEDKNFGEEVVKEVQKQFTSLNKSLPANVGAELLINRAIATVSRNQALTKKNPLAGNQPGNVPGNQRPPVAAHTAVKSPKLSDTAAQLAKRWGYSPEELAKIFPNG